MSDDEVYDDDDSIIEIELGASGLVAWISEADKELLAHNWTAKKAGSLDLPHYYAYREWRVNNVRGEYYLHNQVLERMLGIDEVPKGFLADHINRDKLDNRRENLRMATRSDNEANKRKRRTQGSKAPSSHWKGVTKINDGRRKCWRSMITVEKKQINLGTFYEEKEAAKAYNVAAEEHYGEFALLNVFDD
jgi:hypothetical protein